MTEIPEIPASVDLDLLAFDIADRIGYCDEYRDLDLSQDAIRRALPAFLRDALTGDPVGESAQVDLPAPGTVREYPTGIVRAEFGEGVEAVFDPHGEKRYIRHRVMGTDTEVLRDLPEVDRRACALLAASRWVSNRYGESPRTWNPIDTAPRTWNPIDTAPRDGTIIRIRWHRKRRRQSTPFAVLKETYTRWGTIELEKDGLGDGWQELGEQLDGAAEWIAAPESEADDPFPWEVRGLDAYHWEWRALTDAESAALQQWRPIAEAPRDETPIMTRLAADDENPRILRWGNALLDALDRETLVSCWIDAYCGTPTGLSVGEADPAEWRPLTAEESASLPDEETPHA